MTARAGALVACLASALLVSALAHGQTTSDENDRRARIDFNAGREAFDHGDFREAAVRFERAYQLSNRPALLYNLGTVYDRLHRWTEARDAFQQYLEAFPHAPERDEIRGRLAVIEDEIRREEQEEQQEQPSTAPESSSSPGPQRVVVVREAQPRVIVVHEEPRNARTAGFVLGGLGLIAGIVSATVGVLTTAQYNSLANSCGMTAEGCPQASIDDINLRATITNVFGVTAGVLVAAGVVFLIVDARRPHEPTVATPAAHASRWHFTPAIGTDARGGAMGGVFFSGAM